eukprot:12953063-Alexandrium_andersonii.AAC.1
MASALGLGSRFAATPEVSPRGRREEPRSTASIGSADTHILPASVDDPPRVCRGEERVPDPEVGGRGSSRAGDEVAPKAASASARRSSTSGG